MSGILSSCRPIGIQPIVKTGRHRANTVCPINKYQLFGEHICRTLFCSVFGISRIPITRISNLIESILRYYFEDISERRGAVTDSERIDKNDTRTVIQFIDVIEHKLIPSDPIRDCSYSESLFDIRIMLTHCMKVTKLCTKYSEKMKTENSMSVSLPTFHKIWKHSRPNIHNLPQRSIMCGTWSRFHVLIKMTIIYSSSEQQDYIDDLLSLFKNTEIHLIRLDCTTNNSRTVRDKHSRTDL